MICWTIEAAKRSRIESIVVSTDDDATADIAIDAGLQVLRRPPELACDDVPMVNVLIDVMQRQASRYQAVFCLQPTTPLRSVQDIDGAIQIMEDTGCHSVVGVVDVGEAQPARMAVIEDGKLHWHANGSERFARRQDLPRVYLRSGSVYLTRWRTLQHGSIVSKDCRALIVPPERAVNVDEPWDLWLAEQTMRYHKR